ncbi:MAG TPA: DUF2378 family protein [Archangium sp.]
MTGGLDDNDVPARVFEALFERAELPLTPAVLEELAAIGWRRGDGSKEYSAKTWRQAIELARRHLHPELSERDGFRSLGRAFALGFGRTVVGRVFRSTAPLFGLERTFLAVPKYLHAVRKRMRVEMLVENKRHLRLLAWDEHSNPEFIAGCMHGIFDVFDVTPDIEVSLNEPGHFVLELRW